MFGSPFVGVQPYHSKLGTNIAFEYIARVTADGGYYEGVICMENKLNALRV
jgi:hypothetical protein